METKETSAITVSELRNLLFEIDDQEMKVKELRAILFNIDNGQQLSQQTIKDVNKQRK